jgi:hypothetical protein
LVTLSSLITSAELHWSDSGREEATGRFYAVRGARFRGITVNPASR